jgi:hypothetical protein
MMLNSYHGFNWSLKISTPRGEINQMRHVMKVLSRVGVAVAICLLLSLIAAPAGASEPNAKMDAAEIKLDQGKSVETEQAQVIPAPELTKSGGVLEPARVQVAKKKGDSDGQAATCAYLLSIINYPYVSPTIKAWAISEYIARGCQPALP